MAAARAIAAMETGRLDDATTANVGQIEGGTAANVVAERCKVVLETRSLDDVRAGEVVSSMVDAIAEAASDLECDVRDRRRAAVPRLQARPHRPRRGDGRRGAARRSASRPSYINTGGGSDANALIAAGLPMVNLANGTQRNHQPDESVTVDALEKMLDLTLAIVAAGAR